MVKREGKAVCTEGQEKYLLTSLKYHLAEIILAVTSHLFLTVLYCLFSITLSASSIIY
jgi:hypothetical protein